MTDADREWVMNAIKPKSDQLNADDLIAGPMEGTITEVRRGSDDQPVVIKLDCHDQPYKPCKSMVRVIVQIWGDKPATWVGQRIMLRRDPSVKWGGVEVGGIRIRAMSGISETTAIMLTQSRGKRAPYQVDPLEHPIDRLIAAYNGLGVSEADIADHLGHSLSDASPQEITALRNIYRAMISGETTWDEATGKA